MKSFLKCVLAVALTAALVGCGPEPDPYMNYRHKTAETLYTEAQKKLKDENYHEAASSFDALAALYPFNKHAKQAQLNLIYARYMENETELAALSADRYVRLYPTSQHIDYAYYMKGLLEFKRGLTWLQRLAGSNPSERDLTHMFNAYKSFHTITRHYKHSKFLTDAIRHMAYIRNSIAKEYVRIAQLYFDRKAYVATVNRCNDVILHYQHAPAVIDALKLIVQAYTKLGLDEMAKQYQDLLDQDVRKAPTSER